MDAPPHGHVRVVGDDVGESRCGWSCTLTGRLRVAWMGGYNGIESRTTTTMSVLSRGSTDYDRHGAIDTALLTAISFVHNERSASSVAIDDGGRDRCCWQAHTYTHTHACAHDTYDTSGRAHAYVHIARTRSHRDTRVNTRDGEMHLYINRRVNGCRSISRVKNDKFSCISDSYAALMPLCNCYITV